MDTSILWFRQDLRLQDNRALAAAIERGDPIVPIFVWAEPEDPWRPGAASQWWLSHALTDLQSQLAKLGSTLILRAGEGSCTGVLAQVAKEVGATAIFFNEGSRPGWDQSVSRELASLGLEVASFSNDNLIAPGELMNKAGKPFQVFTPMWRHLLTLPIPRAVKVDLSLMKNPKTFPTSQEELIEELRPTIPWDQGFTDFWGAPSREQGWKHLKGFTKKKAEHYPTTRDLPADDGTSRLSPYLAWGQIGVREAWELLGVAAKKSAAIESGLMRQLGWREFSRHLLHHFPQTIDQPLRPEFALFPWEEDEKLVRAWQRGETGYPIVDAGMRQLWETGWMHNRVRMIVGSFLVKHLLQHWLEGARWFWDTLVDADLPNNTMGWQWIAGCGADAAPYFRVFNPIAQGEKFDKGGNYVKRYLPELAEVPTKFIHRPWELGPLDLQTMGVTLGKTYPHPVIEHAAGRARALEAWETMKSK